MSVRERLPETFIARMRGQLGNEAEEFLASYEENSWYGVRLNTAKISVREAKEKLPFLRQKVPWTENGFYADRDAAVSRHPYYFAGLYYIQEPSAILPASRLPVEPGDMVLDLCSAPGGKATELASRLNGTGLLVANDVSAGRAKALLKNLTVWGAPNICITAETPRRLLESFGCCFDKILVDAPCSGEGMFRKDSGLIASWTEKGPESYAPLQKEILSCAVQMLKPGGMLLYSTCTFSEEENEAVIADVLERYTELSLAAVEPSDGFAPGIAMEKCVRLYPHRVRGEGHFLALLQKSAGASRDTCSLAAVAGQMDGRCLHDSPVPEAVAEFLHTQMKANFLRHYRYAQIGGQCLLLPRYSLPQGLRYLRTGLLLGTLTRGRFEPSQALAMLPDTSWFKTVLDLPAEDGRILRYLKGETLELDAAEEKKIKSNGNTKTSGWVLVCADGHGLGWGRFANGSLKNKYYPGWRLQ